MSVPTATVSAMPCTMYWDRGNIGTLSFMSIRFTISWQLTPSSSSRGVARGRPRGVMPPIVDWVDFFTEKKLAGKAKAGIVHSVSGWTRGVQVKLWDPLRTRAIPERLRGVITTRCYTNPRLPLPLPLLGRRACGFSVMWASNMPKMRCRPGRYPAGGTPQSPPLSAPLVPRFLLLRRSASVPLNVKSWLRPCHRRCRLYKCYIIIKYTEKHSVL